MKFDYIGVGTSPLMLIHGTALARLNRSVLLIDQAPRAGGVWRAKTLFGYENVETNVHFIENRSGLYDLLEREYGLRLSPEHYALDIAGTVQASRALFHALVAIKSIASGRTDRALRSARSAVGSAISSSAGFKYPAGGAGSLISTLVQAFFDAGGVIHFGENVLSASIGTNAACLRTDRGVHTAENLVITTRAFPMLSIGDTKLQLEQDSMETHSSVVQIRNTPPGIYDYIEILGDPLVKRTRDIGRYVHPRLPVGERLLVVQSRSAPGSDEQEGAARIIDRLVRRGHVAKSAEIAHSYSHRIRLNTMRARDAKRLRSASSRLTVLASEDLAEAFVSREKLQSRL